MTATVHQAAPYVLQGPLLSVRIAGAPAPKGSLKHVGRGRMVDQLKASPVWRSHVHAAVLRRIREQAPGEGPFPLDGPLAVRLTLTVRKPASAPKGRRTWPNTRSTGDLDKLQRNVFDALADAGAIADDARIVEVAARKVFPGEHPEALDDLGAVVLVYAVADPPATIRTEENS